MVTLREIRLRCVAVCRGCYANLELIDHLGSVHRTVRNIDAALNELENVFG